MSPRLLALAVSVAGATCSLVLMLRAGSRQQSIVLIALFTGWVLSPFAALVWAALVSTRWPVFTRTILYSLMLILTLSSLLMYGGVIPMPADSRPAAVFLLVPLASWVLMGIGALAARALR